MLVKDELVCLVKWEDDLEDDLEDNNISTLASKIFLKVDKGVVFYQI